MHISKPCADSVSASALSRLNLSTPDSRPDAEPESFGQLWCRCRAHVISRVARAGHLSKPDAVEAVHLLEFGIRPDPWAPKGQSFADRQQLSGFLARLAGNARLLAELEELAGHPLPQIHRGGGR